MSKGRGKVRPTAGHEHPEKGSRGKAPLFLQLRWQMGVGG